MPQKSSNIARYHALVEEQIKELEAWIASDKAAEKAKNSHIGADRTVREYCEEYANRYMIIAMLASDLDYPGAQKMIDAYKVFSPAIEGMFE